MTQHIAFFIAGLAKPQPRPRAVIRGKRAGVYDPGSASGWRSRIWQVAQEHAPAQPWTGPLLVVLAFFIKRPKKLMRRKDPDGIIPCDNGADLDNLCKAVLDECNGLLFVDDSQVCVLHLAKYYTARVGLSHCTPGCEITVSKIDLSNYGDDK